MTFPALKEKLHEYINHADEEKVKAIYTLIENEIEETDTNYIFDDKTVNFLEEKREEFISSGAKGYSGEDSIDLVKKELKKRGL